MQHTGMLFLARTSPTVSTTADGMFRLTMLAMDRIGLHQVEPWRLVWTGDKASEWWQAHRDQLTPGTPLQVVAHCARSYPAGRSGSEITAHVVECSALLAQEVQSKNKESEMNSSQPVA